MMFKTIEASIKLFNLPKYNLLKVWTGLIIKEQSLHKKSCTGVAGDPYVFILWQYFCV